MSIAKKPNHTFSPILYQALMEASRVMKEQGFFKKRYNRKKLTRAEMWSAICSKYPSLQIFTINSRYKDYFTYQGRDNLFKILIEMKLHKSRHLTKKQKAKVEYELNEKVVEKL